MTAHALDLTKTRWERKLIKQAKIAKHHLEKGSK